MQRQLEVLRSKWEYACNPYYTDNKDDCHEFNNLLDKLEDACLATGDSQRRGYFEKTRYSQKAVSDRWAGSFEQVDKARMLDRNRGFFI